MYIAPNHPRRQELLDRQARSQVGPDPPEPTGRLLATFPRQSRNGPDQELRIILDEFQGHPYVNVRVWQLDRASNGWWPLKDKGVSIRLREAEGVADALLEALRLADGPGPDREAANAIEPRTGRRADPRGRPRPPSGLPLHHGSDDQGDDEAPPY